MRKTKALLQSELDIITTERDTLLAYKAQLLAFVRLASVCPEESLHMLPGLAKELLKPATDERPGTGRVVPMCSSGGGNPLGEDCRSTLVMPPPGCGYDDE
jgi:hypothetical protein